MAEQQAFDPRFDPAFQRGYVPPAKVAAVPPTPVTADPIGEPPAGVEPELPESAAAEGAVPEAFVRRGVNPYVVILWVVGVIFLLGGGALSSAGYFLMLGDVPGPAQISVLQSLYIFGSAFGVPLVTVGLITIAGLIFFSAWRSGRRRGGEES